MNTVYVYYIYIILCLYTNKILFVNTANFIEKEPVSRTI